MIIITAIGALILQFLVAVVKAAGANALAARAAQEEKDDAYLQKRYDEIARAGRDVGRTDRMLDNGGF